MLSAAASALAPALYHTVIIEVISRVKSFHTYVTAQQQHRLAGTWFYPPSAQQQLEAAKLGDF
jgi:hypothetical protein